MAALFKRTRIIKSGDLAKLVEKNPKHFMIFLPQYTNKFVGAENNKTLIKKVVLLICDTLSRF